MKLELLLQSITREYRRTSHAHSNIACLLQTADKDDTALLTLFVSCFKRWSFQQEFTAGSSLAVEYAYLSNSFPQLVDHLLEGEGECLQRITSAAEQNTSIKKEWIVDAYINLLTTCLERMNEEIYTILYSLLNVIDRSEGAVKKLHAHFLTAVDRSLSAVKKQRLTIFYLNYLCLIISSPLFISTINNQRFVALYAKLNANSPYPLSIVFQYFRFLLDLMSQSDQIPIYREDDEYGNFLAEFSDNTRPVNFSSFIDSLKEGDHFQPFFVGIVSAVMNNVFAAYKNQQYSLQAASSSYIGSGSYGDVFAGKKVAGEQVAVKVFSYDWQHSSVLVHRESCVREAEVLKAISHANIVRYIEEVRTPYCFLLVMERLKQPLCHFLNNGKVTTEIKHQLIRDIFAGLFYLASKGVFHKDLKSSNVMLDENNTAKLIDFGGVEWFKDNDNAVVFVEGTPQWMSLFGFELARKNHAKPPGESGEVIVRQQSKTMLVYAFAVLAWEIMNCYRPFYRRGHCGLSGFLSFEKIYQNLTNNITVDEFHKKHNNVNKTQCPDFLLRCIAAADDGRPELNEVNEALNSNRFFQQTELADCFSGVSCDF